MLIIKPNATDTSVWEIVDKTKRMDVLITTLASDVFNGTNIGNEIDHAIEQNGFAEITGIEIKAVR